MSQVISVRCLCQVVVSGDDSYYLLNMADNWPASFIVHLHAEHWTINNSAKFLYQLCLFFFVGSCGQVMIATIYSTWQTTSQHRS